MYEKEVLPNGLTIIGEEIPHVRSVACGILVGAGVSRETAQNNGISHFIEHMLFKGTQKRTALQIAESMDEVGGRLNAYTGKEFTMFYTVVLDSHTFRALDILSDIFLNSTFAPPEIKLERNVILEEIKMYNDTPDEYIHDLFARTLWQGHYMGLPIIGDKKTVEKFGRKDILKYMEKSYLPGNIIISVAGNFPFSDVVKEISASFGNMSGGHCESKYTFPSSKPGVTVIKKDTEQVHMCIGSNGFSFSDDDRYVLALLNSMLGGSMSSRLFQEVREKRGLAYNIYSYPTYYQNAGLFAVYAGTSIEKAEKVVEIVLKELEKFIKKGVTEEELRKAKEHFKGNMVLGLESSNSRMNWNAKNYYYYSKFVTVEDIFSVVNNVTVDEIKRVAATLFAREKLRLVAIGPFKNNDHFKNVF